MGKRNEIKSTHTTRCRAIWDVDGAFHFSNQTYQVTT